MLLIYDIFITRPCVSMLSVGLFRRRRGGQGQPSQNFGGPHIVFFMSADCCDCCGVVRGLCLTPALQVSLVGHALCNLSMAS